MDSLYLVLLGLVAALTLWGVFCDAFEDTLSQRVGMAFICSASVLRIYNELSQSMPVVDARCNFLLIVGILFYAVGTALDVHRKHRRIRKRIAQQ